MILIAKIVHYIELHTDRHRRVALVERVKWKKKSSRKSRRKQSARVHELVQQFQQKQNTKKKTTRRNYFKLCTLNDILETRKMSCGESHSLALVAAHCRWHIISKSDARWVLLTRFFFILMHCKWFARMNRKKCSRWRQRHWRNEWNKN